MRDLTELRERLAESVGWVDEAVLVANDYPTQFWVDSCMANIKHAEETLASIKKALLANLTEAELAKEDAR